ncbi:MAG: zinc ribbon domain-containing protein [Promethearchaeota archaeon]|jgi:hypothetical protein
MDIAKFNQELSYKVAKANGLEKHKRFQEAIDLWLEISEMALNASKAPKIEVYYKSMLIEKTKQIINHIKDLKSKIYGQKEREKISRREIVHSQKQSEVEPEKESDQSHSDLSISSPSSNEIESQDDIEEVKIVEDSDIKNLPIGFKEIETTEDFKIITPHDQEYVKKILSQDHDMSVFTHDDKEVKTQVRPEPDPSSDKTKVICFACGSEIPANSKSCPTCGTSLK